MLEIGAFQAKRSHYMMRSDPKLELASAVTAPERKQAVIYAMSAGMPLYEIEEFLDWIDAVRAGAVTKPVAKERTFLYNLIKTCQNRPGTQ
jgi:hypothetical protein